MELKKIAEISIESFVKDYNESLYRYLQKITGSSEDAEDILQESLIKIAESLTDLNDHSRLKIWAFRIATNTAMDFFRKNCKVSYIEFDERLYDPETEERDIEDKIIVDEMNECIRGEMSRIAPHYNTVLILYFFEHMNISEIANICEISVSTVKVRLHRGKKLLNRILSEGCNFYYDKNSNIRCVSKPIEK
jgi:RNA polymerase sigma-70 factor (ECF subfamily)